jgi:DNA-binding beta-propeller fold protein YncE
MAMHREDGGRRGAMMRRRGEETRAGGREGKGDDMDRRSGTRRCRRQEHGTLGGGYRRVVWLAPLALAAALLAGAAPEAQAQLAISANDSKVRLVDGKIEVQKSPNPDTLTFIDLRSTPARVLAEIEVPNSVVGPPLNVAITPKEDIALVASSMKIDPDDASKQTPDDRVTVIDIAVLRPTLVGRIKSVVGVKTAPAVPKVLTTLQAGKGASGIAINKAGTLALVANREEGTLSVFTIAGTAVTPAGKVTVGGPKSEPSAVAIAPDGKTALVTRTGDNRVSVLAIDGSTVTVTPREIAAGLRPNAIDIAATGEAAVVANIGVGGGDADTISVIDLKLDPARVVSTYSVGQTPEGIKMSPDGKYVAITVMNGSNKQPSSPFYNDHGLLQVWSRNGGQLTKVGELGIGRWCQGVAWAGNGKTLLAQCMVEEEIIVVRFSGLTGKSLQREGVIKTKGGPAGIGTARP